MVNDAARRTSEAVDNLAKGIVDAVMPNGVGIVVQEQRNVFNQPRDTKSVRRRIFNELG